MGSWSLVLLTLMLTEHDPAKPWLVLGSEHRTIELPEERSFFEWPTRSGRGTATPSRWTPGRYRRRG